MQAVGQPDFARTGGLQTGDGVRQCGFAAPRFAHQGEHFAGADGKGNTVDGDMPAANAPQQAAPTGKTHRKAARIQQRRAAHWRAARRARQTFGQRGKQGAGVFVLRAVQNFRRRALFHQSALVHDANLFGHLCDDAKIVRDKQHRHAAALPQAHQQGEDFGLYGHVQRGSGFVGNQQARATNQRHGNHHALALAAGKTVRIFRQPRFGFRQQHFFQRCDGCGAARLRGHFRAVQAQGFVELFADGHHRIERTHRLLKNHADVPTAHCGERLGRSAQQFVRAPCLIGKADAAARPRASFRQQAEDGQGRDRFAAARFAHQAIRLPGFDADVHALHHGARRIGRAEFDVQTGNVQAGGRVHAAPSPAALRRAGSSASRSASPTRL